LLEIHFFQTCLGEYHTLESFFRLFNSIAIQLYVPHKIDVCINAFQDWIKFGRGWGHRKTSIGNNDVIYRYLLSRPNVWVLGHVFLLNYWVLYCCILVTWEKESLNFSQQGLFKNRLLFQPKVGFRLDKLLFYNQVFRLLPIRSFTNQNFSKRIYADWVCAMKGIFFLGWSYCRRIQTMDQTVS